MHNGDGAGRGGGEVLGLIRPILVLRPRSQCERQQQEQKGANLFHNGVVLKNRGKDNKKTISSNT